MVKNVIIIGAGPAGLTAAYELLKYEGYRPIILEQNNFIGGISATMKYKNNRIDMGGHRFFSKSLEVMDWWENILPIQGAPSSDDILFNRTPNISQKENAPNPETEDKVMLIRPRTSRIYYLNSFFDYPISLRIVCLFEV